MVEREHEEGGGTPFYGQWYFWAGAGAVAAGAAGGAIWIAQPKNPCGTAKCDACINAPPSMHDFCSALVHLPLYFGIGGTVGPAGH